MQKDRSNQRTRAAVQAVVRHQCRKRLKPAVDQAVARGNRSKIDDDDATDVPRAGLFGPADPQPADQEIMSGSRDYFVI